MKTYRVTVTVRRRETFLIEAASQKEAKEEALASAENLETPEDVEVLEVGEASAAVEVVID